MTSDNPPGCELRWPAPGRLVSSEEYAALGKTESCITELVEGRLVPAPGSRPRHNAATVDPAGQLEPPANPGSRVGLVVATTW
ncbi:hypothetical protein [Amycolatopsis sp. FDAARGOS 1241]|uniref:hypothetical protein n=1 Tax=Amycolatopsis sp. FDAARGOS 1241 TaxID=2778070 RepID=UPI00351C6B92